MSDLGGACHLVDLAGHQSFDIASEAFATLDELLLSDPAVSNAYLSKSFSDFFEAFHALLQDGKDYVTLRQALRLLAKVLLNRKFMEVMVRYVGNERFLQIHMNLLRDASRSIRIEAFHVFKIFVANPRKPILVQKILRKNSERLISLLDTLGATKEDEKENRSLRQDLLTVRGVLQDL
jgi:calcium binding protein 39